MSTSADPAAETQAALAEIRRLCWAATRELGMACRHAEQSVEELPADGAEIVTAGEALETAAAIIADAHSRLQLLPHRARQDNARLARAHRKEAA